MSGPSATPSLRRSARAVPAAVPVLRTAATECLEAAGIGEPLLGAIRIAVSEAVSNAVLHAYEADPGEVELSVEVASGEVRVTVADGGLGLRPRPQSPGAGLGLPIISALATTVELGLGEDGGTSIRMTFHRD